MMKSAILSCGFRRTGNAYGSQKMFTALLLLTLIIVVTKASATATEAHVTKRRVIKIDGDIIVGALFPVHRQPSLKIAFTDQCGEFWEAYGIHRIEMFLKTLDEINSNQDILPNVTLGCDIRDSCWYPPVALERSIDFIKNSIASQEKRNATQRGQDSGCSAVRDKPIAGLIGPGSSEVTIQVQNLLSLFHIPQIGYSATSKDLSDKSLYKYFLRVVPSDELQARALFDLVAYHNWTYISTVYTDGNYGLRGIEEFHALAEDAKVCVAVREKVPNNAEDEAYDEVIDNLMTQDTARVVVCFCEGMTIRGLLRAAKRKDREGHFVFIGSDGWNVRNDVVEDIEHLAVGGMSFKLYSPPIPDFDDHYFSLRPSNNTRNVWFREFWQERFKCQLEEEPDPRWKQPCTGDEDISKPYEPDAKLGFVVNALYTMAYALEDMRRDICEPEYKIGLCPEMRPVNGTKFREYLLNVSFDSYSHDSIHFNRNGDPPGRYDIMNFQRIHTGNGSSQYVYVQIGSWDSGVLNISEGAIQWPSKSSSSARQTQVVESLCSEPCEPGKVKHITKVHCCWSCHACEDNEIVYNESTCERCKRGFMPNANLSECLEIDVSYMQWGDTEAVVALVFSAVGIISTLWVAVVFIRHNDTPVVKASTRELSYFILVGICISYLTTLPLVAKPSLVTCYLARILPGFSFALIYGALVTKTNRIARILAGSKKKIMTRKPRFMSATAQVIITCLLIAIECAIITAMLVFEPADATLHYPSLKHVKLVCNVTTMGIIVPLGLDIVLIGFCTLYAVKTRNLPENFNEAKFIGFTMYTTCVIWLAFVPIYFGSDNKVITMCMAISLSATVALILLFCPKIYIIVCKPEKNDRSAFTTSKEVRCHIGSSSAIANARCESELHLCNGSTNSIDLLSVSVSDDDDEIWNAKNFENAAMSIYRQKSFFERWRKKSFNESKGECPAGDGASSSRHSRPSDQKRMTYHKNSDTKSTVATTELEHIPLKGTDKKRSWSEQLTRESGVQTSEELIMPLLAGLRQRKNSSVKEGKSPNKGKFNSSLRSTGRKLPRVSNSSVGSKASADKFFGRKTSSCSPATDSSETDLLLDNEECLEVITIQKDSFPPPPEDFSNQFKSKHLPLRKQLSKQDDWTLPDAFIPDNRSLSRSFKFPDDFSSSSDESNVVGGNCCKQGDSDPSTEELEQLLSDAGRLSGSFTSLISPTTSLPDSGHEDSPYASINLIDMSGDFPSRTPLHKTNTNSTSAAEQINTENHYENVQIQRPSLRVRAAINAMSDGPSNPTQRAIIVPTINIDHTPHVQTGNESTEHLLYIDGKNLSVPNPSDSGAGSLDVTVASSDNRISPLDRRLSTLSTSSTSSNERDHCESPVDHINYKTRVDVEAESVEVFQEYLRSRGLDLDLSSVQCSDV